MSRNWVVVLFVGSLIACAAIVAAYENHRWSSEVASVTQENEALTAELARAEGQDVTQKARVSRARAVAAEKRKQVVVLTRKVESLSSELAATESELSSTQVELETAKAQTAPDASVIPTEPAAPAAPAGECDSNYEGACVPISDDDLDCADIDGPVYVVGDDPHGFDGDGDGVGCEW